MTQTTTIQANTPRRAHPAAVRAALRLRKRIGLRPHVVALITHLIAVALCSLLLSACDAQDTDKKLPAKSESQSSISQQTMEVKPQSSVEPLQTKVQSSSAVASTVELGNDPDILQVFRECGLDMQYDAEQSAIIANSNHRIQVDRRIAKIKDRYATLGAKGSFLGFEIVSLMVPTSKGPEVLELYKLELKGNVERVRGVLEREWDVKFEFRGPDGMDGLGPQITYVSDVWLPESEMYSRLGLYAQTEGAKEIVLECFLQKRIFNKIGE